MSMKEEFDRLMSLFHDTADGKKQSLEEVFSQSLEFLTHLQELIATGSGEDKREAVKMMQEMYAQMMIESKRITERSGLTEEQLVAFAENPDNFTPEQWKEIQSSKSKIALAGQGIANAVSGTEKKGVNPSSSGGLKPPKSKTANKSQWMRS